MIPAISMNVFINSPLNNWRLAVVLNLHERQVMVVFYYDLVEASVIQARIKVPTLPNVKPLLMR